MDISLLLIFFSFGLSLLMSIGLLVRSFRFRNVVLALLIADMGYLSLFLLLLYTQEIFTYPVFFFIQVPVEMSIGPLLYFYVLGLVEDKQQFAKKDWLHFIPTALSMFVFIPYYVCSSDTIYMIISKLLQQNDYLLIRGILTSAAAVFLPVSYMLVSIMRVLRQIKTGNPAYQKILLIFSILFVWLFVGVVGIVGSINNSEQVLEFITFFLCFIILCFYLLSQKYPYLMLFGTIPVKKKTYTKSHLDRLNLDDLGKQLKLIMEEEKLFCDEDLTLSRLSDILGITQHQLSQFLNKYYQKNFNNFVNNYRIKEAQKILVDEPDRQALSIAFSVGFNSYSAFHSAFKKVVEISPAEFRRSKVRKKK